MTSRGRTNLTRNWTDVAVPEVLLPVQLRSPIPLTPEQFLQAAVLADALNILLSPAYRYHLQESMQTLRVETLAWFRSAELGSPFTCERICESLGLDASAVRARVLVHAAIPQPTLRLVRGALTPRLQRMGQRVFTDGRRRRGTG